MANITIDQQKLVLNTFAAVFQNNLIASELVSWRKFDGEMNDRNGLNVSEQVSPRYAITETTSGVKDLTSGVQDSVFGSEQFIVNKTFGASMGWADFVKIRDIGDARENMALRAAATQLSEKIDGYILETATLASNNWVGTLGNDVDTYADIATAYTRLKEEGVDDADLRTVLTYGDRQGLGTAVVAYAATDSMSTSTFRKGFGGEVNGIPTMFTQQLPTLTVGTRTAAASVTVDGASQNVNYEDVAVSASPGQYMTQNLNIVLPSGDTIVAGEVFTIASVNAWDNRLGASLGRLQQFTVITGDTGDASNNGTIRIFPAIIVQGSGTGQAQIDVNTAHATVDAAPGGTAAMTFLGTASTAYKPRVMLQKQAIEVCTADLILPASGNSMRQSLNRVPISVRMWQDSDFDTGDHKIRFDVALTANVRERRRIVRLNGA